MGRSGPRGVLGGIALALALALASCSTPSGNAETTPPPARTTPPNTASSTPSVDPGLSADEQVAGAWDRAQVEFVAQLFVDAAPDPTGFAGLATDEGTEQFLDLVRIGRSDVPAQLAGSESWAEVEVAAGGREATIADCFLIASRPASDPGAEPTVRSQVWTATAVAGDDGWLIDTVSPGASDCVPPELNRQLLDAYEAYHEAWTKAWDPPDPDHRLLAATMTGSRLEGIRELLEQDRADGVAFRDPHDAVDNAVVFELGIGAATVSDCHEAHPDYGLYDLETGERLDEIPPVEPGQLNLTSVDLVRTEDAAWKVTEAATLRDANCEPGGTPYVVAG